MAGNGRAGFGREAAADFRGGLYRQYVSAFKGERGQAGEGAYAWWDFKYLPLLGGLARDAAVLEIGCGAGELLAYLGRRGFSHATGLDISAEQVALAQRRGVHAVIGDVFATLADQAPRDHAPWDQAPADRAPTDHAPVDRAPVQRAPADRAPLDRAPADRAPMDRSAVDQALAVGARTYAAILAVDVFEHFSRDELSRLAPLLFSALEPGGRLLVQTANGAGLFPGQVIYGDLTHMTIFTPQSLAQLLRPAGFTNLTFGETGPVPIRLRGKLDSLIWKTITALASTVRHIETGKHQSIWTENFICLAFKP
jgi:SAM-dependent methyltransferase